MTKQPIDLEAVARSRRRLAALAEQHPEAFEGRSASEWTDILEEVDMAPSKKLMLRLHDDLLERLDVYVAKLQAEHPGLGVTRSSAIRQLLVEGLDRAGIEKPESRR